MGKRKMPPLPAVKPELAVPSAPYRRMTVMARKGSGAYAADDVRKGYRVTLGRGGKVKPK